MNRKELLTIVKATISEYGKDDVGNLAAALTYYAFFSVFPLLLLAITLAGIFLQPQDASDFIFQNVVTVAPGSVQLLQGAMDAAFKNRNNAGILAVIGVVALLFSGTGAFGALDKAINRAFGAEKVPSFLVSRATSFLLMLGFSAVLILSVLVSTVLTTIRSATNSLVGDVPGTQIFWQIASSAASLAVIFLGLTLLYRVVPRADVTFGDAWPGALLAATAWTIVKEVFTLYLGSSFANYDAVYGTLGAVVALLTWIYISSVIILVGAEFSSELAQVRRLLRDVHGETGQHRTRRKRSPWLA